MFSADTLRRWIGQRKAQTLVDQIAQRACRMVAGEVVAEEVGHVVDARGGLAADVRRDDHVGHVPQAAFGRQRLGVGDVEAGAAEVARFERGDQIVFRRPAGRGRR